MFSVTRDDTVLYGCSACDAGSRWPVVEQWYADNPEEA